MIGGTRRARQSSGRWMLLFALVASSGCAVGAAAEGTADALPVYGDVVGEEFTHVVATGDTLGAIAREYGVKVSLAVRMNGLEDPDRLRVGQRLSLSTRRIVPASLADGIVINLGDLGLYWLKEGSLVRWFPVGVGRAAWRTPPGEYKIVNRTQDPIWYVPPSIQREMRERGQPVQTHVPPGPDNPLGKYWLQLSVRGYGIHGTNAPWSVGRYTTHGCVRLRPEDIEVLYAGVPDGAPVRIIDERVKLARLADGTVWLEAHSGEEEARALDLRGALEQAGLLAAVDLDRAEQVLRDAWGVAVNVTRATDA